MRYSHFPRRSALRFYAFVAALLVVSLACARTDGPVDYGKVTPVGFVTPFGGVGGVLGEAATQLPSVSSVLMMRSCGQPKRESLIKPTLLA